MIWKGDEVKRKKCYIMFGSRGKDSKMKRGNERKGRETNIGARNRQEKQRERWRREGKMIREGEILKRKGKQGDTKGKNLRKEKRENRFLPSGY